MRPALLAALLAAGPALAQTAPADTVRLAPGDPALVTDWIGPGTETIRLRLLQPVQQDIGTATQTYAVADGRVTRVSSMTMTTPAGTMSQTDSLVATTALVPLSHHSEGGQAAASLEFMAEGVAGMVTPGRGEPTPVLLETDVPVFDGGWASEVARSLPFAERYVATMPAFFAMSPDEAAEVVLSVVGSEETASGTVWTVEAAAGPLTFTYRIDEATRDLLSTRLAPQPGVVLEFTPAE